jgi:FSR family fosmidomycin resistance protein-like MFS transporter
MKHKRYTLTALSLLHALGKGLSVFYFILLTVFYARGQISNAQVGYIGALFIIFVILGAGLVAQWLHHHTTRTILIFSACISVCANTLLLLTASSQSYLLLFIIYALMGLSVGTSMSGANTIAAHITKQGNRFNTLAKLGMLTDIVRIVLPLAVAGALAMGSIERVIAVIILVSLFFLLYTVRLPSLTDKQPREKSHARSSIFSNDRFRFILFIEFLDSFSSSQLFVFLPLLFLSKGYSLQNSLLLQSAIFIGYLSGRWLIGLIATRHSGSRAIIGAEFGLVLSIISMLVANNLLLLYTLSYLLGICARGTSPAIKALAFDSLQNHHMKKGSALHVIAGDSGSALGQLLFGLLFAWFGIVTPFLTAATVALFICLLMFRKEVN